MLRQPHAHHRDLLAGATAQAPPDAASGEDPDRHLMMKSHSHRPEKPFPCLLAPQLAAVPVAPMMPSPPKPYRSSPHTGPEITTTHRPPNCINSLTAQLTLAADLSVARPRPNPHSERAAPPNTCPFPRF